MWDHDSYAQKGGLAIVEDPQGKLERCEGSLMHTIWSQLSSTGRRMRSVCQFRPKVGRQMDV